MASFRRWSFPGDLRHTRTGSRMGLLEREPWARTLALVLGFLSLFKVPVGTALGIYTLWVLLPAQSEQEYRRLAARHERWTVPGGNVSGGKNRCHLRRLSHWNGIRQAKAVNTSDPELANLYSSQQQGFTLHHSRVGIMHGCSRIQASDAELPRSSQRR